MKIQNNTELGSTELRKNALAIAEAGLVAIDTRRAIRAAVQVEGSDILVGKEKIRPSSGGRLLIVGVGKCAAEAVSELETILGDKISGGVVLAVGDSLPKLSRIKLFAGTHPFPSEQNVLGAKELVAMFEGLSENDFVLAIVSGGGSALLCIPASGDFSEEKDIQEALMKAGADIRELNIVRKHLSLARGGWLAKCAFPARVISLVFSDVLGDDLQFIASGPFVKDKITLEDAKKVLAKHNALGVCKTSDCGLIETPKDEKYFARVSHQIIVSNSVALSEMKKTAEKMGFSAKICSSQITGEARDVGLKIINELNNAPARSALLYGGETTVTVRHNKKGGRNMELALSALRKIKPGMVLISLASDGNDNSDIAGALCDAITAKEATAKKLSPDSFLEKNNSYNFWTQVNGAIRTGATGSNVSDLIIALKE